MRFQPAVFRPLFGRVLTVVMTVLAVYVLVTVMSQQFSPFIYFRF